MAVAETPGLAGFEAGHWEGVMVPKGTPAETIATLHTAFANVLGQPGVRGRLLEIGIDPAGASPTEFAAFLREERERFARMFTYTGLTPE